MSVQIGTTRPARRMFMPAQFVAQGGVMTMAGRMQKGHGITRAAYFHHIFQLKLSQRSGGSIKYAAQLEPVQCPPTADAELAPATIRHRRLNPSALRQSVHPNVAD